MQHFWKGDSSDEFAPYRITGNQDNNGTLRIKVVAAFLAH